MAESSIDCEMEKDVPVSDNTSGRNVKIGEDTSYQALDKERRKSSIQGVKGNWYYPSEEDFLRSATKKGYTVDHRDIGIAVAIHNAVNEETWKRILCFERLHEQSCPGPKLLRFVGRPGVVSPRARINELLWGYELPFDRHDWFVDRCGKTIRYIVDFYEGKQNPDFPVSIYIDARPELDLSGICDRVTLAVRNKIPTHIFSKAP